MLYYIKLHLITRDIQFTMSYASVFRDTAETIFYLGDLYVL